MHFLQVSGIGKQQAGNWVVKDASFVQQRFQKIAIAGETGSGKSSLLKMIAGLEQPDAGSILFEGKKIKGPLDRLIPGHPGIAYLSQHFELRNNYRVEELLEYANKLSPAEAATLFDVCKISHLVKRKVDQLSGGEKQRIALAKLLVGSPRLLLLDEPFSNLDPIHKHLLKSVLHTIGERLQITCILTSHDPMDTLSWADEIMIMRSGEIIQTGSPSVIYHQPSDVYVAGLFGTYNLLDASAAAKFFPQMNGNGSVFTRPEEFLISLAPVGTVQGRITDIRFWGSYYEIEVLVNSLPVLVKTMDAHFSINDSVYISLKQNASNY